MSVAIMNMALDMLKEEPILNTTDNRAPVRWMNRNFEPIRDGLLRSHPWNCALSRAALAADSEAPAFGWDYQYQLPSDCVRILPLTVDGLVDGAAIGYEVEGRKILTAAQAPLKIRYIKKIDHGEMDALFVQALAGTLAARAAHFITGKASYADLAQKAAAQAISDARMIDALEGTPQQIDADKWERARAGEVF